MQPQDPKEPFNREYDGIIENNNPMPRWWLTTFYLTMIFSAIYYGMYQFMGKLKISDEYAAELAVQQSKAPAVSSTGGSDEGPAVTALLSDSAALAEGKNIYIARCAMCHRPDGGGQIGPNLTDDFWLNCDGSAGGIVTVVNNGVDGKGMPPWKAVLNPSEVHKVSAFVVSLRGSNPPNPKAQEGKQYPR